MVLKFYLGDKSVNTLEIEISNIISSLKYNDNDIDSILTEELINLLDDYKKNSFASNVPYKERLLLKKYINNSDTVEFEELLRTFACSTFLFCFIGNNSIEKNLDERIKDQNFHIFDNNFYVDWTGNLGPQPSIYYLSKNIITEKKNDIEKLYNLGFLGKLEYKNNDELIEYYFIPLFHRKISKFQLIPFNNTVARILSERETLYQGMNK